MKLVVVTPPAEMPVDRKLVKQHLLLPLDEDHDDDLLDLLIETATEQAEHLTGRALVAREYRLVVPASESVELPCPPVLQIHSVALVADDGSETPVPASSYRLDQNGLVPRLSLVPGSAGKVRVDYRAGYGDTASAVPATVRRWILLAINTLFENREELIVGPAVNAIPRGFAEGLLDPVRIWR